VRTKRFSRKLMPDIISGCRFHSTYATHPR